MSLTKNTVLGIAAAIAAGFAIYTYMEPTTKAQPQKKAGLQRKPNKEKEKGPGPQKKKHQTKGSEESPKKKHNKKQDSGPKSPKTA
jgi:hypothetical protein